MKTTILSLISGLFLPTLGIASANGVWADGYVTYKHPNGQLISRECSMLVPSMGIGDVTLKCGDFSTTTNEFSTEHVNGQVIFSVLFRNMSGAPAGTVAKYRGSYLRGSNQAIYYGDVFSTMEAHATLPSKTTWKYIGGFMFSKSIGGVSDGSLTPPIGRATGERTSAEETAPVRTVSYVDLNRYLGKWYEIASFPQSFQKGCVASSANYSLKTNGKIAVLNECRLNTLDGPLKSAKGTARVVDTDSNAKLKVTFFWPFSGDYWIIDLDPNYQWAVVGDPSREYLWILSRTPQLEESVYQGIVGRLATEQSYDVSRLNRTLQPISSAKSSEENRQKI